MRIVLCYVILIKTNISSLYNDLEFAHMQKEIMYAPFNFYNFMVRKSIPMNA